MAEHGKMCYFGRAQNAVVTEQRKAAEEKEKMILTAKNIKFGNLYMNDLFALLVFNGRYFRNVKFRTTDCIICDIRSIRSFFFSL